MADIEQLEESEEQQVTPWKAQAAKGKSTIDYDKLIGELSKSSQTFVHSRRMCLQQINLEVKELIAHFLKG